MPHKSWSQFTLRFHLKCILGILLKAYFYLKLIFLHLAMRVIADIERERLFRESVPGADTSVPQYRVQSQARQRFSINKYKYSEKEVNRYHTLVIIITY